MDAAQKEQTFNRHNVVVVDPNYDGDKIWKILEHAINEIFNHNGSSLSYGELYRHAYNMVVHNFGDKLYTGLKSSMTCHLKEISKCICRVVPRGDLFLEEIDRKWTDHNKSLQMICDILMYMDRTYVPRNRETRVYKLGLNLWRDIIVNSPGIQRSLLNRLLDIIVEERTGTVINRGLVRNIIKMLLDLGYSVNMECYDTTFLVLTHCDCADYIKEADQRLDEEVKRVLELPGIIERT